MLSGSGMRAHQCTCQGVIQDFHREGGLARAGYARHADKLAKWDVDGQVFEVVLLGSHDAQALPVTFAAGCRNWNEFFPAQVCARD